MPVHGQIRQVIKQCFRSVLVAYNPTPEGLFARYLKMGQPTQSFFLFLRALMMEICRLNTEDQGLNKKNECLELRPKYWLDPYAKQLPS